MNLLLNSQLISKFRSELMGLATIGILMCHAHPNGVNLPFPLDNIFGLGQMGVMLFFFLSGIGLSFSLGKVELSCKSTTSVHENILTYQLLRNILFRFQCEAN